MCKPVISMMIQKAIINHRNRKDIMNYRLPKLHKKVVYIDQFALSYMVRTLHPEMKATGNNKADHFWLHLYQKLDYLIKMQMIICPQSDFHLQESLVSSFFEPLEKMYHYLSQGVKFAHQERIKKEQLIQAFRSWFFNQKQNWRKIDFLKSAFKQDINIGPSQKRSRQRLSFSEDYEEALRKSRECIHNQWIKEFQFWKKYPDTKFNQWLADFYLSLSHKIIDDYPDDLKRIFQLPDPQIHLSQLSQLLIASVDPVCLIHDLFRKYRLDEQELWLNIWQFLHSEMYHAIPFIKIYALFYAALARKAGSGQKKPPDRGVTNDLGMLSLLLPYCDAMFIDNQCRGFLEEGDVQKKISFHTRIFSLSNKMAFLDYLDHCEKEFPLSHRKKVESIYGQSWINSMTQLYS